MSDLGTSFKGCRLEVLRNCIEGWVFLPEEVFSLTDYSVRILSLSLPLTEEWAKEYWTRFGDHVMQGQSSNKPEVQSFGEQVILWLMMRGKSEQNRSTTIYIRRRAWFSITSPFPSSTMVQDEQRQVSLYYHNNIFFLLPSFSSNPCSFVSIANPILVSK